jgi:hypothetical protein
MVAFIALSLLAGTATAPPQCRFLNATNGGVALGTNSITGTSAATAAACCAACDAEPRCISFTL